MANISTTFDIPRDERTTGYCLVQICTRESGWSRIGWDACLLSSGSILGSVVLVQKQARQLKILWWDVDGFAIFAKKLEVGTFCFPDVRFVDGRNEPVEIERADLMMLLDGIDTGSVKRLKRYRRERPDQSGPTSPKPASRWK